MPGAGLSVAATPLVQARLQLSALDGGGFIELRVKLAQGMRQHFFTDVDLAASFAVANGISTDVYCGVIPRSERRGGRKYLMAESRWMWAECDTETAVVRALDMRLPPPMVIRSSRGKGHCYWPLSRGVSLELVERGNRRLAFHLGADPRACDAARILRVAGTFNHKYEEPQRVALTRWDLSTGSYLPSDLVGDLPDPAAQRALPLPPPTRHASSGDSEKTKLAEIPARQYVFALTGREVLHNMVSCPFHNGGKERTPSLHVAGPNDTLWHCFGCNEGGDVFTFAAKLWGKDDRKDFPAVKKRLGELL